MHLERITKLKHSERRGVVVVGGIGGIGGGGVGGGVEGGGVGGGGGGEGEKREGKVVEELVVSKTNYSCYSFISKFITPSPITFSITSTSLKFS